MRQEICLSQKLALGFKREGTQRVLEGAPLMNLEAIKCPKKKASHYLAGIPPSLERLPLYNCGDLFSQPCVVVFAV